MSRNSRTGKSDLDNWDSLVPAHIKNEFFDLPFGNEQSMVLDAVYSVVISYFRENERKTGFITERQSLQLLLYSNVDKLAYECGMAFVEFRGIHSVVFSSLTFGRTRITVNAYITLFLPRFTDRLNAALGSPSYTLNDIYAAIIYPVFERTNPCGLGERIMCNGILCNRALFARAACLGYPDPVTGQIKIELHE
ncbi:unnamed protein product [Calicophoron daubneyi]|uniref:Uncharacterized protein n=1 Tax=Calicophoron daubneyi TaxID=300641 RepID=A0AAV2TQZ5_CALDB